MTLRSKPIWTMVVKTRVAEPKETVNEQRETIEKIALERVET